MDTYIYNFKIIFLLIILGGCDTNDNESSSHIEDSSGYDFCKSFYREDLVRIPLIFPYEVLSASDGYTWIFEGYINPSLPSSISGMDSVGVNYPYISFYIDNTWVPGDGMTSSYFVMNVLTDTMIAIQSEDNLRRDSLGILLFDFECVVNGFRNNSELPWNCIGE